MEIIKKYWWALVLVILFPPVINLIISRPTPCFMPIVGESKDWLNFFAVYFSSIIAAFVSFFILYKTIQSNNNENEKNRDIQTKVIKYQTKIAWINNLKEAINQVIDAIDESIARDFISKFKEKSREQDFSAIYFKAEDKLKSASFSLETVLLGCNEPIETEFLDIFREFKIRYQLYIDDVIFLLQYPNNFKNPDKLPNTEYFKREILRYKSNSPKKDGINPERLWEIAEKYEYKLISKRDEILHDLFRWADSYLFKQKCKELLYAEYKIAESLLLDDTKQDK